MMTCDDVVVYDDDHDVFVYDDDHEDEEGDVQVFFGG